MNEQVNTEREVRRLVESGVARDIKHAFEILEEMSARKRRADLFIFYIDIHPARECFRDHITDELPYNHSAVMMATVPSGALDHAYKVRVHHDLVIGMLKEFVLRQTLEAGNRFVGESRLVATSKTPFEGKDGIFFSPFSAEEVRARGKTTYDEQHGLYRIEFEPIAGDFLLGMFEAWKALNRPEALVLYIAKSQTLSL